MEDFFHMIAAVLLFLSALGISLTGVYRLEETMASPAFVIGDTVAFERSIQMETEDIEVSQLEAMLLQGTEFGVRVEFSDETSMEITVDCIDMEAVQRICRADAIGYKKTYDYDAQGTIRRLIFTQIKKE